MPSTVPHTGPYDSDFDDPLLDVDLDGYEPDRDERNWGLIAHLSALSGFIIPFGSIVGPLVVYLTKRDESAFVEDQAREALNFQITIMLASIVAAISMIALIGFVLLPAVLVWWLVGTILGGVRASNGERYRYPFTIRFVKG